MNPEVVFAGTFDPLHGAHIGQLLRAHRYSQFQTVNILLDKHPPHKPQATGWQHRLKLAELVLGAFKPPFDYVITPVSGSMAPELKKEADYKIIGVDSLLEDLADPERWKFAQRWPMLVLSVPGIADSALTEAVTSLPGPTRGTIVYEYIDEAEVPILNYDFDQGQFITRRVHATDLRSGQDTSLIPLSARQYIRDHDLYQMRQEQ